VNQAKRKRGGGGGIVDRTPTATDLITTGRGQWVFVKLLGVHASAARVGVTVSKALVVRHRMVGLALRGGSGWKCATLV
jgi:hypothetical protein